MKSKPSFKIKILNDGVVSVPLKAGYESLFDRIFGLTKARINLEYHQGKLKIER